MQEDRWVTMWSANGLTVTARRGIDDALVISGQDLNAGATFGAEVSEYEYSLRVAAPDIPVLLADLKAPPEADVLDVLEASGAQVVREGESRWLARIGVEAQFWARHG